MWREIIEQNKSELINALTELETALRKLLASVEADSGAQIDQLFSDAGKLPKVFDELNR
jgi:prephenate dehydrogenase